MSPIATPGEGLLALGERLVTARLLPAKETRRDPAPVRESDRWIPS
jgi:hypothetical protein